MPQHRRWLRRAGLLHDIGKLAVSNQILDKPGKPDEAEWQAIRSHPGHGEAILDRVPAFADIAPLAGATTSGWTGGAIRAGSKARRSASRRGS